MLVNLYKSKSPAAVVSLPILIAVMGLSIFLLPDSGLKNTFLWQDSFVDYINQSPIIQYVFTVLIVYLTAIELVRQVNVFDFYSKNTYLPGFFYGLSVFGFGHFGYVHELIAIFFIVYALGFLFRLSQQESAISSAFTSALLLGTATVFQPLFVPLLILPWLALSVFRSFVWREWFVVILAAGIPWLHLFAVKYLVTGHVGLVYHKISFGEFEWTYQLSNMLFYGFTILLVLSAFWRYVLIARTSLLVFKKRSRIVYNLFWLILISYFATFYLQEKLTILWAIPLMYIFSVFYLNMKSMLMANLFVYLWILLAFWSLYQNF